MAKTNLISHADGFTGNLTKLAMRLRGHPEPAQASKSSRNPETAARLWDLSARLTRTGQAPATGSHHGKEARL